MKKRWNRAVLAGLLCLCMLAGCAPHAQQPAHIDPAAPLHTYQMTLFLREETHTLQGEMTVTYRNPTEKTLKSLPFSLYPNAYRQESTAPFFPEEMPEAYPEGFSFGGIEIHAVKAGDTPLAFQLCNEDGTRMDLELAEPLEVGESIDLHFAFTVTLPHSLGRFGYGEKTVNLCNFYPIACPYVNGAFLAYPYYAAGDPFVSNVCNYRVELSVPQGTTVAHTGICLETKSQEDRMIYRIQADAVRDFAAVAGRSLVVEEMTVGDVTVRSYTDRGDRALGKDALVIAGRALALFSEMIGDYTYDTFSVVQTDFFIGGMEYPGLVLIDQSLYTQHSMGLEEVVVHETGHQWWYAAVGSDQVREPWLDEALTDYITKLYYYEAYGEEMGDTMYYLLVDLTMEYYQKELGLTDAQLRVGRPSYDFDNATEYSVVVYTNGTKMLHALQEKIGIEQMLCVLQTYYAENKGTISQKQRLLEAVEAVTGEDHSAFFAKWL